jgi:hypothetical protein
VLEAKGELFMWCPIWAEVLNGVKYAVAPSSTLLKWFGEAISCCLSTHDGQCKLPHNRRKFEDFIKIKGLPVDVVTLDCPAAFAAREPHNNTDRGKMRNRQSAWRTAPANTQSAYAAKPANVPVALAAAMLGTWLLLTSTSAYAQTPTSAQLDTQELRRTQEREAQLRAQQERVPDVLGPTTGSVQALRLPTAEAPCFKIRQLELRGYEGGRFGWVLDTLAGPQGNDAPLRKCLGAQGVGIL